MIILGIWFLLGLLGVFITNKYMIYESNILKYIWSIIITLNGGFGLLIACLMYLDFIIFRKK